MTRLRIFGVVLLAILIVSSVSFAGKHSTDKGERFQKTSTNDDKATFLINNIFNYYSNNGDASYNTYTGGSGFEWPKGSGNTAIFEEGLVWSGYYGAKVAANLRTGGSAYRHGLQAGRITNSGLPYANLIADDPGKASNHTYRVRPDINPSKTFAEVKTILDEEEVPLIGRDVAITAQTLYNRYIDDWNNWPASQGAPFDDKNGNGTYEPSVDIPGVPGADQTLWHVSNDLDAGRTTYMYGSNPIGLEYQRTIWGYRRTGALGNTVFSRNKIINKSDTPLDSAFFSQWSDPDLGDAGDDFVACDITRSLGYVYNGRARDTYYGDKPPAAGYDFFQGPIVPSVGDSGIFNNKRRYDVKNLGMSAFNFFINSSATYTDPRQGVFTGTGDWYNLMNGKVAPTGAANIDKTTGLATKFMFSGDPTTGKGWIEGTATGSLAPPGDRRLCSVTGPFKLAPGDTQEVVVATIVGQGGDRISSISVLKFYSDIAQSAFDNFFNLAAPPPSPVVSIAQLDGEVILDWSNVAQSTALEAYNSLGYTFEGYNIYQATTPAGDNKKLLATYDVVDGVGKVFDNEYDEASGVVLFKPVQFGNDNGVTRYYDTKTDNITGRALINGQPYYYAVTAYGYNAAATPKSLESAQQWKQVIPQKPVPGVRYSSSYGDTVATVHTTGVSDGSVVVVVVDPTKVTGHDYSVTFADDNGSTVWNLKDLTLGTTVLTGETNQSGDNEYKVVDGLMVKAQGPPPGMKDWSWTPSATRFWTFNNANWGSEGFSGAIGNGYDQWFSSSTVTYGMLKNVDIKFATTDANGNILSPTDPDASYAYRYIRGATGTPAQAAFAPFIINKTAGYAFQDYNLSMPMAAYDMEATPPRRLMVGYLENNAVNALLDGKYWPPFYNDPVSGDNIGASGPREWFYIFDVNYSTTPDASLETDILNNTVPVMWFGTITRRNTNAWTSGNTMHIITNHVNLPADVFTFTAPKVTTSTDVAKADIEKINVFPNPYFGLNLAETSKYQRFVTFSHLPKNATIRIFTLSGVLVRTLVKPADETQQFLRWNLTNESGLPIAAGMFIAYIDMPDLGKTKILKFAVIPESQILDKL
ncbi:MAG: hypothetical protein EHM64_07740 [Ignavibacteriae bacterium]|nr:MAG: hypothetical protein EHM64_07740 [Ignavibacteriota bacterium]